MDDSGLTVFKALGELHDIEIDRDGNAYRLYVPQTGLERTTVTEAIRDQAIEIAYGNRMMVATVKDILGAGGPFMADLLLDHEKIAKLRSLIAG